MPDRPIRCGFSPVLHGGFPDGDRPGLLLRLARIADEGGVDTFWVEDHTRLPGEEIRASEGVPGVDEPLEAWTTLAFLAGATARVRLGTEVTPITLRPPALFAKALATLDVLTGGRVTLGAGTGWNTVEFRSLGIPFEPRDARYAKTFEALALMRALWRESEVTHAGAHYRAEGAVLAPKPVQPGGPPIWFGGFSDRLLDGVIRYGDGWILGTNPAPEFVAARWARLRELAAAAGRDVSGVRVAVPVMAHLSRDRERAQASIERYIERGNFGAWLGDFFGDNARRFGLIGTPEDALARLQPYLAIGIRDFIFDLRPPGIALESAELLANEVLPRLAES
jgi:probable F420-dependent oxidoreductase